MRTELIKNSLRFVVSFNGYTNLVGIPILLQLSHSMYDKPKILPPSSIWSLNHLISDQAIKSTKHNIEQSS